ncbi:hypothetical protein ACLKA7_010733 [Drosophila subpalustris]
MKERERIPYILNGEIFRIESRDGDAVTVQCLYCPKSRTQKHYGNLRCTGNFHRHIKRCHPFLIDRLREMKKARSAECAVARSEKKRHMAKVERNRTLYLQSMNEHFMVYDTVAAPSSSEQQHPDDDFIIYDDAASSSMEEQPPDDEDFILNHDAAFSTSIEQQSPDGEDFIPNYDAASSSSNEQQPPDDDFVVYDDDASSSSIEKQPPEKADIPLDKDEAVTTNLLHELRSLPKRNANQLRARLQKILIDVRKKRQKSA